MLSKYKLCPCSTSLMLASNNICLYFQKIVIYAKQKHPGCKKVQGQSEAALQIDMCIVYSILSQL